MASQLYNNVSDALLNSIGNSQTSFDLVSGNIPVVDAGDYTPIHVTRSSDGAFEIMHVTDVSGSTVTVTRAAEGTSPLTFPAGEAVQIRPTRQSLLEMAVDITDKNVSTSTGIQPLSESLDQRWINFPTISDLDASPDISIGDRVKTSGYSSSGDGGGNDYEIVAAGTGVDDGGSFIDLSGSGLQAKSLFKSEVRAEQFGVVGSGADDGAALGNFFNYCSNNVVEGRLPAFKMLSSVELSLDTALCSIIGRGHLASLIEIHPNFPVGGTLLTVTDSGRTQGADTGEQPHLTGSERQVFLRDFGLSGNQRSIRAHGIVFVGANDDAEVNMAVHDFKGRGVAIGDSNAIGSAYSRETVFQNLHVKNCGDNKDGNDFAALEIKTSGPKDGTNNLWFDTIRLVYPRGRALKVIPSTESDSRRIRRVDIKQLFLHGNQQLPNANDPQGENWRAATNMVEIGISGAINNQVSTVFISHLDAIGQEDGQYLARVVGGSALHVLSFSGFNPPGAPAMFFFQGAASSSIRNFTRQSISVGSTSGAASGLIEIVSMESAQHKVSVSGINGTTIPNGSPGYIGNIDDLVDENVISTSVRKPVDPSAASGPADVALTNTRGVLYPQRLQFYTDGALTADDTDYATIRIVAIGASNTVIGNITTRTVASGGTGDWSAGDLIDIPIIHNRVNAGEFVVATIFKNGAGVLVPEGSFLCEFSPNLSVV